jgi:hypothetical protein
MDRIEGSEWSKGSSMRLQPSSEQVRSSSHRILLLWEPSRQRRELFRVLCATGVDVEPLLKPEGIDYSRYCTIIIDYDQVCADVEMVLNYLSAVQDAPPVLLVTSQYDPKKLTQILNHRALTNLIVRNTEFDVNELVITTQKIIRGDIFGIDKYLTWGPPVFQHKIESSRDKGWLIEQLKDYLGRIGCNKRLIGLASGVADELILNAVYNAPVNSDNEPKYAHLSRDEAVTLCPGEESLFGYSCDGCRLAISVGDKFGRITQNTIFSYLQRCFSGEAKISCDRAGGAGLGLYNIFQSVNQFVINVDRGRCTEMIGLMNVSGTYRDFAEKSKSLNIFTQ